jgi:fermentation-respiration switch protein FrsA (DUF1100 family)
MRLLLVLLALAAAGYAAVVLWLIRQETRLVFEAGSTLAVGRPSFPYEQIDLPRADGARQFAWVMRRGQSDDGLWVLYLHGNATSIASQVNISRYRLLTDLELNLLAPEYRGFGGLDGTPTEATLQADARTAYDYLRNTRRIAPQKILLYGWSLGSAVAVNLAFEAPPAAIVLEGAPASLADLTTRRYPFLPLRLLMRSGFDSIRKIGRIPAPMLFLHSADDEVIPIAEGHRLFEAARGAKTFVELRGGHLQVSDVDEARMADAIASFIRQYVRAGQPPS